MKFTKQNFGFTLVEIVVVIGIMAIFSAVMYSSFDSSKAQSRDQQRISDISTIQIELEQYFQKRGVYPLDLNTLVSSKIASSIPTDPKTHQSYADNYMPLTKSSGSVDCISYHLWTNFETNSSYLGSKKGFNSNNLSNYYECGSGHNKIDASSNSLVYDVMP